MNRDIQQAINNAIASPDYRPPLPKLELEVWNKVFDWRTHRSSNDCLEWLGDGLMYAAISVELYRQVPKGSPDMFTRIRGPIVTNQTFALLTNKLNLSRALIHEGPYPPPPNAKCFADLFEVLPAEVYLRGGFDVLREWVGKVFGPLITAAVSVYERQRVSLNKKRKRIGDQDFARLTNKRQKTSHAITDPPRERPVAKSRAFGVSSGQIQLPSPVVHDTPSLVLNPTPSKRPMNNVPLPAMNASSSRKEMPHIVLSVVSRNTSPVPKHSVRERPLHQAKHSVKSGDHNPVVTHRAAWKHAMAQGPDPAPSGLEQAVLASPSRYTAAAPSAPACGPGSSRFDPIIIDGGEDELEDGGDAEPTAGPSREVVEIVDDDDSGPDQELVETLLVMVAPARRGGTTRSERNTPRKA